MTKKVCSFCGRSEKEAGPLITGVNGYICMDCAKQAYEIVRSAGFADDEKEAKGQPFELKKVPLRCTTITSVCNSRTMTMAWK